MEIKEVQLLTHRLNEIILFYGDLMGYEITYIDIDRVSFRIGGSTLTFHTSSATEAKYHLAFTIPHNQLNEAIQWASGRIPLIKVEESVVVDFPDWNAKSIYFYDSVGNILEFIARFGLDNASDIPFGIHSILSISEIGIATDNPLALAEQLHQEYMIPYFPPGPKREDFVAMGNDEGLLVISRTSRNWFPTQMHAEKYFQVITINLNHKSVGITLNE